MRILLWSEAFWPQIGGVEILTADLVAALHQRGHDVRVVTDDASGALPPHAEYRGVAIHRLPMASSIIAKSPAAFASAREAVARLKRDVRAHVVHVQCTGATILFHMITAEVAPAPVLATIHSALDLGFLAQGSLMARLVRQSAWLTCVSDRVREHVLRALPDMEARSSVIRNSFQPGPVAPEPLPFAPPRLLFAGRLIAEKGAEVLLEALPRVLARIPDLLVTVAGDGVLRSALEERAAQLRIADRIAFLGWVPPGEIAALLNGSTLLAMPSLREGLPLAGIEAAFMQRPIVASRVGGLPELVIDGETGILVEPGDAAGLAEAILAVLGDEPRARAMGQRGRRHASTHFGWQACVDAYEAMYQKVTGGNADGGT